MPFPIPTHPSLTSFRAFTSTTCRLAKSTKKRLEFEHSAVPIYPYGPSQVYKQSNFGLYGAQRIRFGNMVSEKNEIKTRRYWRPNVQLKRLWSDALGTFVRIRVTTRVLRTVDKCGGLDEYLLGGKAARIKELGMGVETEVEDYADGEGEGKICEGEEAAGLPSIEDMLAGSNGNLATKEQVEAEIALFDEELEMGPGVEVGEEEGVVEDRFMKEKPAGSKEILL